MTARARGARWACAWLGALTLGIAACAGGGTGTPVLRTAAGEPGGVGGTGLGGEDSGIGGTGLGGEDSGVGGTGIFGTITALGSIWVNGLEVELDPETRVEIDGEPARVDALAVGQLAWVETHAREGMLHAERVAIFHALVGPVEAVDPASRRLTVLGQTVKLAPRARLLDRTTGRVLDLAALVPGDAVRIAALPRAEGPWLASRLERGVPDEEARLLIPAPPSPARELELRGLRVELASGMALPPGPPGRPLVLEGRYEPAARRLQVTRLQEVLKLSPHLVRLSLEGFLEDRPAPDRLRVHGLEVEARDAASLGAALARQRIWLTARILSDHRVRAERVRLAPPHPRPPPLPARPVRPEREGAPRLERPGIDVHLDRPEIAPLPEPVVRPEPIDRPEEPVRIERIEPLRDAPERLERAR